MNKKKQFKSTEELYGVKPEELKRLNYEDALKLKYNHLKKVLDRYYNDVNNFYKNGGMSYEDFSLLFNELKKKEKAFDLVKMQLDEIKVDF